MVVVSEFMYDYAYLLRYIFFNFSTAITALKPADEITK